MDAPVCLSVSLAIVLYVAVILGITTITSGHRILTRGRIASLPRTCHTRGGCESILKPRFSLDALFSADRSIQPRAAAAFAAYTVQCISMGMNPKLPLPLIYIYIYI